MTLLVPTYTPFNMIFNNNGVISPGGTVGVYLADTETLADIYLDADGTIPAENPYDADDYGRLPTIFIGRGITYKMKFWDSDGNLLGTYNDLRNEINPASIITTYGDLIVGDIDGDASRLPKGSNTTILGVIGGAVGWYPTTTIGLNTIGDYKFSAAFSISKWLLCNGTAVSRTTYSALFGVIGTSFGVGDGSTTFNLPDMGSSVPGAIGQRSGLTNRTLGTFVGEESHTMTTSELVSHNHQTRIGNTGSGPVSITADNIGIGSRTPELDANSGVNTGSSTPFNVMQPTLFIGNCFIYSGV